MSSGAQPKAEHVRALQLQRAGRTAEAAAVYRALISADPGDRVALHRLGVLLAQSGNPAEGERLILAALEADAADAVLWCDHGNVLDLLGRREEALSSYDRALALAPDYADALTNRGNLQLGMGRAAEALAGIERAGDKARAQPLLGIAHGNALLALDRLEEAIAVYDRVIAAAPNHLDAAVGRGVALKQLGRYPEAIASFDRMLSRVPGHVNALLGRAHAQILAGRPSEPIVVLDKVVAAMPGNADAWYIRGLALRGAFRTADALQSFERAASLNAGLIEAVYNVADTLSLLARYAEAIPVYERVLAAIPGHTHAICGLAAAAIYCCDWPARRRALPLLEAKVREGQRGVPPFTFLSLSTSPALQLDCARNFTRHTCPEPAAKLGQGKPPARKTERLRLAYLSSDFRRHAMAYQMAELFELHDRSRFEVLGISGGPDDGSPIRQRILKSFDEAHDVSLRTNEEIARLIHERGVDIVVDLNGHTVHSRMAALAWRPAPVQATYLGFPGTSGAPFIDYVLADATVAPMTDQPHFTERIVHLPGCYQVSDRRRQPSARVPSRAECGLPQSAVVFCCFNSSYKLAPEVFAVWMRLLTAVPGSVLWLVQASEAMRGNLRREAAAAGVDPDRLVFCHAVEPDAHLARHALADLFLDTLPYNSHGTGSFALWAGLPLLTCLGPTFAGRVAASLLQAIGLPELVTRSLDEYEAAALKLARDPELLAGLRQRLMENRHSAPLFDTDRFRRTVEKAYRTMWEIAASGGPTRAFTVEEVEE